ncbi:MAG TPA: ATP-binding protein [Tepidisphaeraceae bacterium]|nr:ATP-binding protein [Tepidisphaeraceae bacterium]
MSDASSQDPSIDLQHLAQTRHIELNITSDPANLGPVRHAIESLCTACGFDETSSGEVGLCVNEALANITRHAYNGATDRPIKIIAHCPEDELRITIRDWGDGESPDLLPPDAPHDPMKPGGIGLVCLRQLMDQTIFTPQEDGMLLTMTRKRKVPSTERANG